MFFFSCAVIAGFMGALFLLVFSGRTVSYSLTAHLLTVLLPTFLGGASGVPIYSLVRYKPACSAV